MVFRSLSQIEGQASGTTIRGMVGHGPICDASSAGESPDGHV
jgi:hypothetical protein